MIKNKLVNPGGARRKDLSQAGLRLGLLLAVVFFSALLQGCFLDRLITLRSQACAFDEHFGVSIDRNLVIEFYDPVFLEKDMQLIWGAAPTTISRSDRGSTMRYLFERTPVSAGEGKAPLLEEFSLEFDFVPVDGQLRLSKISSNDLPAELLLAANNLDLSSLDEMAEHACQVEVNPFTRSLVLPLDPEWFKDLPSRNELTSLYGLPGSTLDEGKGLVYEYRLKGSGAETHTAKLVIWYDETGNQPLLMDGGFSRYQMQTNLLTALMKVQFSI